MLAFGKTETREKLLTAAVFMGIFFPVRLLFYTYVSQYWFGSFGLMTGILLSLFYLAHKKKLGWLGRIVLKHIQRFSRGKVGLGVMVSSVFVLYFFGNIIYGIETAPREVKQVLTEELESEGIQSLDDVAQNAPRVRFTTWQIILGILLLIVPNAGAHSIYGIINDMSNGWVLHFSTVFFVEQLEVLGLIIYFRYKKYPYSLNNS